MPIDGIMLNCISRELSESIINTRIEKIYQPSSDEIIFNLRSREGLQRLHFSVSSDSPHVNITQSNPENPSNPPMFCMYLRKYFTGCIISDIRQVGLDRILYFDLSGTSVIGDPVNYRIVFEAMPRHANFIILNSDGIITECLKKTDYNPSTDRAVLPGFRYKNPPAQNKLSILDCAVDDIVNSVLSDKDSLLSSAMLKTIEGVSPLVSREITYGICGNDLQVSELDKKRKGGIVSAVEKLKETVLSGGIPTVLIREDGRLFDITYTEIKQYGQAVLSKQFNSYSALIDYYYAEKSRADRTGQQSRELQKTLNNLIARSERKLLSRQRELEECEGKDKYRVFAEIILSNQYSLEKGSFYYDLPDYYNNYEIIRIPADPALSPSENAHRYFKEYNKLKNAEKLLDSLIEESKSEIEYLQTVLDSVMRADSNADITEIKTELSQQGYLKNKNRKKQLKVKPLPPAEYLSDDGYRILVGRNNIQNDILSFKTASKSDSWFHTQKFPGSHVVVIGNGDIIPELTCRQAAVIAAFNSSARESSQVAVDYTEIRQLKKPTGAKPGKVIYHTYNTMWVTPDKELCERLRIK